jgi:hypothetical protein
MTAPGIWEASRHGAFDAEDQAKEALDWVILRDGGITLYWRREYLQEDLKWFRQQNYQLYSFNCEKWTSGGMQADLGRTLNFSSYYGRHLDAFQKGRGAALLPSGRAEGKSCSIYWSEPQDASF